MNTSSVVALLGLALLLFSASSEAQRCPRDCAADRRDPYGCCIRPPASRPNRGSCALPVPLALGRAFEGSTSGRTDTSVASCGGTASSPDAAHVLRLSAQQRVTLVLDADFDAVLYVRSRCSDPSTELPSMCNDDETDPRHSRLVHDFQPGTYFVFVDGSDGARGNYRLLATLGDYDPWQDRCERESQASACTLLGRRLSAGSTPDEARAARYFERACAGGDAAGCDALGRCYRDGRGVLRDDARAVALFEQACAGLEGGACASLAALVRAGRGAVANGARVASLLGQACDRGDANGCAVLGIAALEGTLVPRDDARAAALLLRACSAGDNEACAQLATLYATGRGVVRDDARAATYFERACAASIQLGCVGLGELLVDGRGLSVDWLRAKTLFERACAAGVASGCGDLARLYYTGRSVARDAARAVSLWTGACRAGDATSCASLQALRQSASEWSRTAQEFRGQISRRHVFHCPAYGMLSPVYGTTTYADNSSVCSSAVHAGRIRVEQGGDVTIVIRPPSGLYDGSFRNGVESLDHGPGPGSYVFE